MQSPPHRVTSTNNLDTLALTERVSELLQRTADELGLLPQVGGKETVGVGDGNESSLEGVLKGLGRTGGGSVSIFDTSELEETLDSGRGNETGTTGGRDKLYHTSMLAFHAIHQLIGERTKLTRTVTEPHLPLSLQGRE